MTLDEIVLSLFIAILVGIVCGLGFSFMAVDTKPRRRRTVLVGVASGLVGWAFAMILPIKEYKIAGIIGFTFIAAINGSHLYWAAIKSKSNFTRRLDVFPSHLANKKFPFSKKV
jgi:hypothetical protein